ncbi:MAG: shikimate kinase [Bacillota bacterium]
MTTDWSSIALIGMMGAGKTRIGRELAAQLGWRFIDLDRWIEEQEGQSITELFSERGEDYFRLRETRALAYWADVPRLIIATGGGIVQRPENRLSLKANYRIIFLEASISTLWERVRRSRHRPLLRVENPRARLRSLLQARQPIYREWADLTVRTDKRSAEEIVAEIIERLDLGGTICGPSMST